MAKPNYSFEKRQRELAKKKKKEEKQQRKTHTGSGPGEQDAGEPSSEPGAVAAPAAAAEGKSAA